MDVELEFNINEDYHRGLCANLRERLRKVERGGGDKKIAREHERGKMTARERVSFLLDKGSDYYEIGAFAADGMYAEYGGCPSAGVVVVIGRVSGRQCVIVANDATVKAGAWFPMTAKKNLRAQEIAMENRIPIIYLVDSAGVFLPLQDEIFPDKEHFGRIFRNNAKMSAMGIVQVAAIMGSCVAGGAYLPIMSDEAMMVEKTGTVFLAGSYLVKAAIGETIDNETLGGAHTHNAISGVADYQYDSDEECLKGIRDIFSRMGKQAGAGFDRIKARKPVKSPQSLFGILPKDGVKPYNMRSVLERIVDGSELQEYKEQYGQTLICAYARIDGWAVGIVANQRTVVKNGKKEMQMGGVIYGDAADKAARFVMNCNQKRIPLVFFQDVSGFMVGSKAEHGGIIKDGAKLVSAMANSVVPKFTVVVGNSFGAGNYAMCGKAYDPRLMLAWPSAKLAVMSGASAAKTLLQIKKSTLERQGKKLTAKEEQRLLEDITSRYEEQLSPYYAAARLWIDAIISPLDTRRWLANGIELANNAPLEKAYNAGILQT